MPRLSTYKIGYDSPEEYEVKQWEFWTEEERSLVIGEAYKRSILTSEEVKPYLSTSRMHSITQWVVPIGLAALYQGVLKKTAFNCFYRKSPAVGRTGTNLS